MKNSAAAAAPALPPARHFADLLLLTPRQRATTLALPFLCAGLYFGFAYLGWWGPAVGVLMGLSFLTYGSTSHDLVHANLGLSRPANSRWLGAIELLALRSGHAYRLAHLHHHARYPQPDDIEGAAAGMSLPRALLEGLTYNPKLYCWALRRARDRAWVVGEGGAILLLWLAAAWLAYGVTPVFLLYAGLMTAGSWVLPVMTSYMPHSPHGATPLFQTRLFRGKVASIIALEHLYHLEHHLYPAVPHHHWPELARRLDPYFEANGVKPVKIGF